MFCFTFQLYGQRYAPEFYLWIKDVTQYSTHIFDLELISSKAYCFDWDDYPNEVFVECDDCTTDCDECEGGTESIYVGRFTFHQFQKGFGLCALGASTADPRFGFGVYKLSHRGTSKYIYLDIRDDRYSRTWVTNGYHADFRVQYDGNGLPGGEYWEWDYDADGNWNPIDNGGLVQIWEEIYSIPETGDFPSGFWDNCLVMTVAGDEHPRIVWGRHPTFSPISGYKVYRATTVYQDTLPLEPPDPGDYSLQATLNSSTFTYKDPDVIVDDPDPFYWDNITWYYVKAYYEHPKMHTITYSSATNIVHVPVEFYKPIVKKEKVVSISEYRLNKNYPNPFNPSTKISFEIPEKSPVELVVYDIQGKKVVTLVNETLESGNYSVEFNAGKLPSGTYLYKIVAGKFTDIKKMMLVK